MRTKSFLTLMLMLVALSVATVSCKKDGVSTASGGSVNPTNCDDPEGTITANLRNDDGYITLLNGALRMNTADNFEFDSEYNHDRSFVNIGEVDGLGCVSDIPETGWSNQVAVIPGNGYVVRDKYSHPVYESYVKYARICVTRYILSVNDEILGAEIKYQNNWCQDPQVDTKDVTDITQTTAICGGFINDGGMNVTERGICWSLEGSTPTINGSHLACEETELTEEFSLEMTGLLPNTSYTVRAYIISDAGTIYGQSRTFKTLDAPTLATITTNSVTNITQYTAICGGNITSDGGSTITQCGICWSTTTNPNIHSSHISHLTHIGSFTIGITGLQPATTYYAKAYATNGVGTSYGEEISFTTLNEWQNGILPGLFSVSETKKVKFSQGNLRYKASTDTWRFASNQYDYIGTGNANISPTYNGWIDLFGWGTSGWNNGNVFYHLYDSDNVNGAWYGPSGEYDLTGNYANSDWGVYNAISNGGNTAGMWRTLTKDEWNYLINDRNTSYGIRFAKATVNGVGGLILLPDDWIPSIYSLYNTNQGNANYSSNTVNVSDWVSMENAGAVFLPAAGYRNGNVIDAIDNEGSYWSASTTTDISKAYYLYYAQNVYSPILYPAHTDWRSRGHSVRLVRDAQ